jgi:UBX domain-containing protein 1
MPIVTLDSMKKNQKKQQAHESDEDDKGGNEYYTGGTGQGGTGSGLAVLAPTDRGGPGGAARGDPLGQMMERLQREQAARGGAVPASGTRRVVNVTVYRNGFTVDDGPLRTLEDERNQAFMRSLTEGYCPEELIENGQPADVKLENKMKEDYSTAGKKGGRGGDAAGPQFAAFGGSGSTVGELAMSAVNAIVPGTQGNGSPLIVNDGAEGIVKVQIKFPDGKREVAKFEKQHTVRHLISRVELLRPNLRAYHLLSGDRGPPKPLEPRQYDQTLTEAGLAGALVSVKENV